jgi:hypothetical protein
VGSLETVVFGWGKFEEVYDEEEFASDEEYASDE